MKEQVQRKRKASKFSREDVISIVPDDVMTNIMNRLPIQDAVKTGILSKNWRVKWTMLTQVVFDKNFFNYFTFLPNEYGWEHISRLLHDLKGPIEKFVLYIPKGKNMEVEDINRWVMLLSLRGIKELTLENMWCNRLKLSTKLYACMQLKHLKLSNCCFRNSPRFRGFPNLLSLDLWCVKFEKFTFGELTARCPLLESLIIGPLEGRTGIKLVEILKLVNLKMLSLRLDILESAMISSSVFFEVLITSSSMFQLTSLPKLQELHLKFEDTEMLAQDGAQKKVSTAFLCLKTLKLSDVDFTSDIMSSFVIEMISGSQNLQTLEIKAITDTDPLSPEPCSLELDCNNMGQLQLRSVVLDGFAGLENEVFLIKFILDSSPFLKKFFISPNHWSISRSHIINPETDMFNIKNRKTDMYKIHWELAKKLLKLHRASPVAEIDIQ